MTMLLKHQWTNQNSLYLASTNGNMLNSHGYVILSTKEFGNILCIHTKTEGTFTIGDVKVQELFHTFNCTATLTCFPYKHYQQHPEIAKSLHILFPDIDDPITFNPTKYYPDITVGIKEQKEGV